MNKDISPLKYSSFLPQKNVTSPFKKFNPRNINQDQQLNVCSPLKYINTDANPQMGKNLTESAHHLGGHNNRNSSFLEKNVNLKQQKFTFVKQNSPQNQLVSNKEANHLIPFTGNSLNVETNLALNRQRKFSYNQLSISPISPKFKPRQSQIKANNENQQLHHLPQTRDRKLSFQTGHNNLSPHFLHKKTTDTKSTKFLSPFEGYKMNDINSPNQKDLMKKKRFQENPFQQKTVDKNFNSLNFIPDDPKSPVNSLKKMKFRKNSDNAYYQPKDMKTQVPSFLLKKMQKQSISPNSQAQDSFLKQQKRWQCSFLPQQKKEKKFGLKDFIVLKELGEGKFGKVLLVKEKATGFVCAMKVFKKSQIKQDNFIDQFIRQLKIHLYLNHPNVIKMYGYFDDLSYIYVLLQVAFDGTLYQLLENFNHEERLRKSGIEKAQNESKQQSLTGLSMKQTAFIMYQLCSAIKYLHSNNIIHRDLKPQNIVIHEKTIKLCDFGWSVFKGSQMRTTFCGTPLYLCPQLITGELYDEKVDIWAIGIMLYEFLIGPNPFNIKKQADLSNIIFQNIEIGKDMNLSHDLDPLVIDLINGCLNKDPLQRLDIKQIASHEFFKKYCPQLITSNNSLPRTSSLSTTDTIK